MCRFGGALADSRYVQGESKEVPGNASLAQSASQLLMRFLYLGDVLVRHHDPLAPVLLGTGDPRLKLALPAGTGARVFHSEITDAPRNDVSQRCGSFAGFPGKLRARFTDREVVQPDSIVGPPIARLSRELRPGFVDGNDGAAPVEHCNMSIEAVEGRTE
ncbi:MAG: hypothetical protein K0R61_5225 [Microvirga sp.]|nr:hypothetical protein [Microvirga sp.]